MTKEACIRLKREARGKDIKIINTTHDEINCEAPGKCWLDLDRSVFKQGVLTEPVYSFDEEALEAAKFITDIMVSTETEFFQAAGSDIVGRAEYAIAPFWKH